MFCPHWIFFRKSSNETITTKITADATSTTSIGSSSSNKPNHFLRNTSSALTLCFFVEVIMKMIAFTPYGYWQSRRNRGDLLVTILGVAWIILDHILNNPYTLTLGKADALYSSVIESFLHSEIFY